MTTTSERSQRLDHARILMYSHDTFGLGHLRRCRAIAHALVERFKGLSILIISGSPIAGTFEFRARVDFVKIPSVIKLYNGEYTSIDQLIDLSETLTIRKAIIRHTAEAFSPDIFIVDKEPLGLKGEVEETLRILKERGTTLVLGLRDVMDDHERLAAEWGPTDVLGKIEELYDDIWVYGLSTVWDPLVKLDASARLQAKLNFTGYLRRKLPAMPQPVQHTFTNPYILVSAGGGGDGAELMDNVLAAYEHDRKLPHPALLVLGPFMPSQARDDIHRRAHSLENVHVIDFDNRMENLFVGAIGVVGMCGYNTFCEILSFDKRAIIVPRVKPRKEQLIRARRASELGLVRMMLPEETKNRERMARALRELPGQLLPSHVDMPRLLDGLDVIGDAVENHISRRQKRPNLTLIKSRKSEAP